MLCARPINIGVFEKPILFFNAGVILRGYTAFAG